MKVLVCGGRDYADRDRLDQVLHFFGDNIELVIAGAARGVDTMAVQWAKRYGVAFKEFPVTDEDWRTNGRHVAARERNQQMLDDGKPNFVIAFPGGPGTKDMVRRAKMAGVPVLAVDGEIATL